MKLLRRTWSEIDLDALENNIENIKNSARGKELIAVVKANAYGHDDDIVCTELFKLGVKIFAVSNIWEGEDLRKILPKAEIIIFGYTDEEFFDSIIENDFILTAGSVDFAKKLNAFAEKANVKIKTHVKLDTGMSRVGIDNEAELCEILGMKNLSVLALCTHFSVADSTEHDDSEYTFIQYNRLHETAEKYKLPFHSQNSGGLLFHPNFEGDYLRAGLIMFGYSPDCSGGGDLPFELKPVMSLKAAICQIKTIKKGASVSYGRTFTAHSDILAAVIPAGYADGYSRALSNKGKVLINGVLCPVIGRVCMDQIIADVTNVPEIKIGDVAEIYSSKNPETAINHIACVLGTIPYEIVCSVSRRVPRVALRGGKIVRVVRYS